MYRKLTTFADAIRGMTMKMFSWLAQIATTSSVSASPDYGQRELRSASEGARSYREQFHVRNQEKASATARQDT